MPKSSLDWLGVASIWIGGIVLAFKSASAPLVPGAPAILAAGFWNYVPAVLASLAMVIFLYRQFWPVRALDTATQDSDLAAAQDDPAETRRLGALDTLRRVRSNTAVAIAQGTMRTRMKAFHEFEAAMVTANKEFGIKRLPLIVPQTEKDAKLFLELGVRFLDCILPLLREGHVSEARIKAAEFTDQVEG